MIGDLRERQREMCDKIHMEENHIKSKVGIGVTQPKPKNSQSHQNLEETAS